MLCDVISYEFNTVNDSFFPLNRRLSHSQVVAIVEKMKNKAMKNSFVFFIFVLFCFVLWASFVKELLSWFIFLQSALACF